MLDAIIGCKMRVNDKKRRGRFILNLFEGIEKPSVGGLGFFLIISEGEFAVLKKQHYRLDVYFVRSDL